MRDILNTKGQELLDLAVGENSGYKETSYFSQDVCSISSNDFNSRVNEEGEVMHSKHSFRFNFSDQWKEIIKISLVRIDVYSMDKYNGERGQHIYEPINDIASIIHMLVDDGYILNLQTTHS